MSLVLLQITLYLLPACNFFRLICATFHIPLAFLSKLIKLVVAIRAVFIKLFCLGDKKNPASRTTKQHKELRQSGKLNYERLCLVGGVFVLL